MSNMYHLGPNSHQKVIVSVLQRQHLLLSLSKVGENSHSTMVCCSVVLAPANSFRSWRKKGE